MSKQTYTIALLGNPNSGKSSLFNQLTGLRQKVGNFPGVTVDKKIGTANLPNEEEVKIIDFPGTYSLHPNSQDEQVVLNLIANPESEFYPELIVYVASAVEIEKHLLLFSQLQDLGFPMVLALSMSDIASKKELQINSQKLAKSLGSPVVLINNRKSEGLKELKNSIQKVKEKPTLSQVKKTCYPLSSDLKKITQNIQEAHKLSSPYHALLWLHHFEKLAFLTNSQKESLEKIKKEHEFNSLRGQINETMQRYETFKPMVKAAVKGEGESSSLTDKIDRVVMHRVFGPAIFFVLMLVIFQAIFTWSAYPMDWIEQGIGLLGEVTKELVPKTWFRDLLTEGIIAGLGGVLVFIPQIAILFFLVAILEGLGYMARAVFMFDKVMQKFGLNGRSIVALISGGACAIPAVMSTRTIGNWKERLITIMVTPLISCSARIPVYVVLIGFVVPSQTVLGIFNLQGLAFMGLYVLGIVSALGSAFVFNKILKTKERSFLMMQLPEYRTPEFKNIAFNVLEKVKSFVFEAGKIIMIVSMILWVLASYGPTQKMQETEKEALQVAKSQNLNEVETADLLASRLIESSYIGHIGHFIEPAIRPLGFDWKIGIALITSFAAREVFVGTMATIYSIGSADDELSIHQRMAKEINPHTLKPVYTPAVALSLLLFYVFAMQCVSTLAVVKRETNSWKWPAIQFTFMSVMAYLSSLLVYQLLV